MWARIKTLVLVVVLSGMIWIYAERAVIKTDQIPVKIMLAAPPGSPMGPLLVQFLDENGQPLEDDYQQVMLTVQGSTSRLQAVKSNPETPMLDITTYAAGLEDGQAKDYNINVVNILHEGLLYANDKGRETYIQVTQTEPQSLKVRVTKLTQKNLTIKVFDLDDGTPLVVQNIKPDRLEVYIPDGQPLEARVTLSKEAQLLARQKPIKAAARIHRPDGWIERPVLVKLAEGMERPIGEIKQPRLGIFKPISMEGKFRVEIAETDYKFLLSEYSPIRFYASPESINAYRASDIHLILRIKETDQSESVSPGSPSAAISRPLEYYLPPHINDIEIIDKKNVPINFRLVKIPQ